MKAVILAGGSGTRLWPLSRKNYPKQFLKISGIDLGSLLQQTVGRLLKATGPGDILIMTSDDYRFHVQSDILDMPGEIHHALLPNMLLEPAKRNTAPAIALALAYAKDRLGCSRDEVVFISPADHVISPEAEFVRHLRTAERIASQGRIVTFGVRPLYPETGYGYIKTRQQQGKRETKTRMVQYRDVDSFTEKPDRATAEKYLKKGDYFWNSGMFAFTIGVMEREMKLYCPEVFRIYRNGFDPMLKNFSSMPDISIDYAVMEKSKRVVMLPLELSWSDVGSWDSIFDLFPKDDSGNVAIGDVIAHDTKDSLVMSDRRLIATVGLEKLLVVETDDAVLIARRGDAQKVKNVVEILNARGRREATEHTTTYRPWGSYTVLEEGKRYKIKRLVVNEKERLSLQMHYHRSEHWVVIKGTARVTTGQEVRFVHENESVYIPKSTLHRLENPGRVPLEIIEVQNGEYVGEDDIVRFDDQYGRQKKQRGGRGRKR